MEMAPASGLQLAKSSTASRDRVETAARELEAQFAHMLIKSMRAASPGDPMGGSTQYRDMHDQQLARELTKGRGLGLQSAIIRQLEHTNGSASGQSGHMPLNGASSPIPLQRPTGPIPLAPAPMQLQLAPSSSGASLGNAPISLSMPPFAPVRARAATAAYAAESCRSDSVDCSSKEAFVSSIWPAAQQTAQQLGVSPHALVAQAALETDWGRRMVGVDSNQTSNNLFGIKATGSWSGESVSAATHEYANGQRQPQRDSFRAYGSVQESFQDYARLISSDRYDGARAAGNDVAGYAQALQRAGYATDPNYASKITAIANGDTIKRVAAKLTIPRG